MKRILIFGTGMSAVSLLKVLDENLVYGFIDNDKAKIGKSVFSKRIFSIEYVKENFNKDLFIYNGFGIASLYIPFLVFFSGLLIFISQ